MTPDEAKDEVQELLLTAHNLIKEHRLKIPIWIDDLQQLPKTVGEAIDLALLGFDPLSQNRSGRTEMGL